MLQANSQASSLEIIWSRPAGHITSYRVSYTPSNGQPPPPVTVQDVPNPSITLTNLLDNTEYTLFVVSVAGEGFSETMSEQRIGTFTTGKAIG